MWNRGIKEDEKAENFVNGEFVMCVRVCVCVFCGVNGGEGGGFI